MANPPFKIFVSSPVDGIVEYRKAVSDAADILNAENKFNPRFHVFLYEQHQTMMWPGLTVSECIVKTFGKHCDGFIVFFKDRVGSGTLEEFEIFENTFLVENPNCKLWWAQIACKVSPPDVHTFKGRLYKHATEMIAIRNRLTIEEPADLHQRVISRLTSLLM